MNMLSIRLYCVRADGGSGSALHARSAPVLK